MANESSVRSYEVGRSDLDELARRFTYHASKAELGQAVRYGDLRHAARELAIQMMSKCPASRERSLALTKLEEAVMWANAAIARNE